MKRKRYAACFALLFLAFAAFAFDPEPYIREELRHIAERQLLEYHFYAGRKRPENWKFFSEPEFAGVLESLALTAKDSYAAGLPMPKTISEAKLMAKLCWDYTLYISIREDWIVRERK